MTTGTYTALAYGFDTLRAKKTGPTVEAAALKALKAALPEVNEIVVYKRMQDGHDAWVDMYGKTSLDELARIYRKGATA